MFKALAFRSLCLAPNKIDFVLSWPKCTLNLLSTNQSHKLENLLVVAFQFQLQLHGGKLCKYHLHKITNH